MRKGWQQVANMVVEEKEPPTLMSLFPKYRGHELKRRHAAEVGAYRRQAALMTGTALLRLEFEYTRSVRCVRGPFGE